MEWNVLNMQMLHGGDYNPDQWLDRPDILEKDIELMKQAHINAASVGIFAWSALEPEEGRYEFDWLKSVIDRLYSNGIYTVLATPSGARPVWMALSHPEVLRVGPDLVRNQMGGRHNHCYTSPYYRQKVWEMDRRLSEQFGRHPGVILWHISNEFGGECYCPLCQQAFREWLQAKYGTIEELNSQWWTAFWSHTYSSFDQIEPPLEKGEQSVHALVLDWKRFVTDRTVDFCAFEKAAIRAGGSELPVTTNLMGFYNGLNYFKFRDVLDIASWDNYPFWHTNPQDESEVAITAAATHDLMRCIKQAPFLLMESVPGVTNWHPVCRMKKPGMHELSSLQAVAHGSNSVQYFQWRKSRGSSEKFHGAVVGHDGTANTRIFREVTTVGTRLEQLQTVCGTNVQAETAIIYDWENRWALDQMQGLLNGEGLDVKKRAGDPKHYSQTVLDHYEAFWRMGISADIVDMSCDFSRYKLVIAPMLYMQREDIVRKLRTLVEKGGTLVGTYWSGLVNENDLCFESFAPYGMQDVFGLYSEEIDALYPNQRNAMVLSATGKTYELRDLCDVVHVSTAQVLATYSEDYYAGCPALTLNRCGQGHAYYLCARADAAFYRDFYGKLADELHLERALESAVLPHNVSASLRKSDKETIAIVQNFNSHPASVCLSSPVTDIESGEYTTYITLPPYGIRFLRKSK
ncbi:MAG: beta-galactosidase [Clostridia bacterium]|nr:beta-galactosidase [Clostridia bacterium]